MTFGRGFLGLSLALGIMSTVKANANADKQSEPSRTTAFNLLQFTVSTSESHVRLVTITLTVRKSVERPTSSPVSFLGLATLATLATERQSSFRHHTLHCLCPSITLFYPILTSPSLTLPLPSLLDLPPFDAQFAPNNRAETHRCLSFPS
jgi:hypothetical protein